jgi:hypothetical protein
MRYKIPERWCATHKHCNVILILFVLLGDAGKSCRDIDLRCHDIHIEFTGDRDRGCNVNAWIG